MCQILMENNQKLLILFKVIAEGSQVDKLQSHE